MSTGQQRYRSGGVAAWSIRRPIGVSMLALTIVVLGLFALDRLGINLLPDIIYPEVRVRIVDPGVPALIMEDQVTRQLEEQLAITEGSIAVQSNSSEGQSTVDLSFAYGTDIDVALRDASTRLDRAKRFLPDTIDPPIIFKRDPSQIPVLELVISSSERDAVELRTWVDYTFAKWFLNLPGVAAAEVGGGLEREIQVVLDQYRLGSLGLTIEDVSTRIQEENQDLPAGRVETLSREIGARTNSRFQDVTDLATLPLWTESRPGTDTSLRLQDVARVLDTHQDERLRIRLDTVPGIKLSIQKQPTANTVAVVDEVLARLEWLKSQRLIPPDIQVERVADQSVFVRYALNNASMAALSGALLAMLVVYLFLGNLRRTLIIGTAIPLAVLVTFTIMGLGGLTLNIMTLGGLALGIGMLVDNTIVMLENITRHQRKGEVDLEAGINAAREVNGAIVAATTTNLAAVLPFLFIGGLVGLLFRDLIITISAAIVASLVVAITLVPALGARVHDRGTNRMRRAIDATIIVLQRGYTRITRFILRHRWLPIAILAPLLVLSLQVFSSDSEIFLPQMDTGEVEVSISAEPGTRLEETDAIITRLEQMFLADADVSSVFTTAGGRVFGRSEVQASNSGSIKVLLVPASKRPRSSHQWVKDVQEQIKKLDTTGLRIRMTVTGIRGIRVSSGDDSLSIRVQGQDLEILRELGDEITTRLRDLKGFDNLRHNYEETRSEISVVMDRQRAAELGIRSEDVGRALRAALDGLVVSDYFEGDRQIDIRLRLPRLDFATPDELGNLIVGIRQGRAITLRSVATVRTAAAPSSILRDNQRRIVEVSATLSPDMGTEQAMRMVRERLADLQLPEGYNLYDGGELKALREGRKMGYLLLGLAIFLVFVVMAVQYESLTNPLVILTSVPFAIIGVAAGLHLLEIPLSMPVWLGLIMMAGIVVNNAIMLVEQIEIERGRSDDLDAAITEAARLRLRPILMTTLTTVVGMLPLAVGFGEGSEMLQPLAVVIVWGLSFSMLVSLVLVPVVYRLFHRHRPQPSQPMTT